MRDDLYPMLPLPPEWQKLEDGTPVPNWAAAVALSRRCTSHAGRAESARRRGWHVADEFGWAKTYDANYVALARLLGCRLITLDGRLRRGADRLGFVIGPTELG